MIRINTIINRINHNCWILSLSSMNFLWANMVVLLVIIVMVRAITNYNYYCYYHIILEFLIISRWFEKGEWENEKAACSSCIMISIRHCCIKWCEHVWGETTTHSYTRRIFLAIILWFLFLANRRECMICVMTGRSCIMREPSTDATSECRWWWRLRFSFLRECVVFVGCGLLLKLMFFPKLKKRYKRMMWRENVYQKNKRITADINMSIMMTRTGCRHYKNF